MKTLVFHYTQLQVTFPQQASILNQSLCRYVFTLPFNVINWSNGWLPLVVESCNLNSSYHVSDWFLSCNLCRATPSIQHPMWCEYKTLEALLLHTVRVNMFLSFCFVAGTASINERQYRDMPTHGIGRWRHLLPKQAVSLQNSALTQRKSSVLKYNHILCFSIHQARFEDLSLRSEWGFSFLWHSLQSLGRH